MNSKLCLAGTFAIALLALPARSAADPSISAQTTPGVNFGDYGTYGWVSIKPRAGMDQAMFQQILYGIDSALAQKGYLRSAEGDISLIITIGERDKKDKETWARFAKEIRGYDYHKGQLSLDAFETVSEKAIWHGQATEVVDIAKPDQVSIDAAVRKLMDRFPARPR